MTEKIHGAYGDVEYATFHRRMFAATIDVFLIAIVLGPLLYLISYIIYGDVRPMDVAFEFIAKTPPADLSPMELMRYFMANANIARYIVENILLFFLLAIFIISFWSFKDATIGKMVARCKIVDAKTFGSPSAGQYIIRFVGYCCAGFLFIGFSRKKRGLHDLMAGTAVIKIKNKNGF